VNLGNISEGSSSEGFFVLCAGNPKAKISGVVSSRKGLKTSLEKASVEKRAEELGIRCLGYVNVSVDERQIKEKGFHTDTVEITTSVKERPSLSVRVDYYLSGGIIVKPCVMNFGIVREGDTKRQSVSYSLASGEKPLDLRKLDMDCEHPFMTPEVDASGKSISASISPWKITDNRLIKGSIHFKEKGRVIVSVPYIAYLMK